MTDLETENKQQNNCENENVGKKIRMKKQPEDPKTTWACSQKSILIGFRSNKQKYIWAIHVKLV